MRYPNIKPPVWLLAFCLAFGAALLPGIMARAQAGDDPAYVSDSAPLDSAAGADSADNGPVRMARFSYVSGEVTWRGDGMDSWAPGALNMPLRQGAQIGVTGNGHAEIQFDDGSLLRLGGGAVATLQTLYSDSQGEFTEIKLSDGLAALRLRDSHSIYQVDTPVASLKAEGPAKIRVGVGEGAEFAVTEGQAVVEGAQGQATLHSGDYLDQLNGDSAFSVQPIPGADSWDRWNADRDRALIEGSRQSDRYLPPNIALSAGNLDDYGSWHSDPSYGEVWCPRESASWRPYYDGRWVWVEPFGWTWCGNEPWGWAPYHYGSWIYRPYGWVWIPGPAYQYWCPAVVDFCSYDGYVGWAPLCPAEVHYPVAFSLGVWGRNWYLSFGIGEAGCYYPYGGSSLNISFFFGHAWDNHEVNFYHGGYGHGGFGGFGAFPGNTYTATHFLPYNVTHGAGGVIAQMNAFGGTGSYRPLPHGDTTFFTHGRTLGLPAGHRPFSGPATIRPSQIAMTPTRTFSNIRPAASVLSRPVVRAPLPPAVAQVSRPFGPAISAGTMRTGSSRTGSYQSASGRRPGANPPVFSNRNATGAYRRGGASASSNIPAWERARQDLGQRPTSSGSTFGRERGSSQASSAPGWESRSHSYRPAVTNNSAASAAARARQDLGGYSTNRRSGGYNGSSDYAPSRDRQGYNSGRGSHGYTPYGGSRNQGYAPYGRGNQGQSYTPSGRGNESQGYSRDRQGYTPSSGGSRNQGYAPFGRGSQDSSPYGGASRNQGYTPYGRGSQSQGYTPYGGGSRSQGYSPYGRGNESQGYSRGSSGNSNPGFGGRSGNYSSGGSHSYGSFGRGSSGGYSGGRTNSGGGRTSSGGGRSDSGHNDHSDGGGNHSHP